MKKIIKIDNGEISLGCSDSSEIIITKRANLNFDPQIGDEVEVFGTGDDMIVHKKEKKEEKFNINIMNQQSNQQNINAGYLGRAVNKVVYALLALFLGGLGAHKFYSGKTFQGILYFVFSWTFIPSFIAFIEGIMALLRPADAQGNIYF